MLPGLDGTEIFLRPLIARLETEFDVTVLRYPNRRRVDYSALADILMGSVLDRAPCCLLASSFGGPLAVLLAERLRDRVGSLVLCTTFARSPRPWLTPLRPIVTTPTWAVVRALRRWPHAIYDRRPPDLRAGKRESWHRVRSAELAARARAAMGVDVTGSVRRLRCPILYLRAARDRVVPSWHADSIASLAPHTEIATIEAGHLVLFTHAAAAATTIAGFLRRHSELPPS
jgi:pimeloyl-ACP methyl ester carboxylesterase